MIAFYLLLFGCINTERFAFSVRYINQSIFHITLMLNASDGISTSLADWQLAS